MADIYALVCGIAEQMSIIEEHCFGTCGKIIVGGLDDAELGAMMVCRTESSQCPQFDRQMDEPIGHVNDEPVFLRKLKP